MTGKRAPLPRLGAPSPPSAKQSAPWKSIRQASMGVVTSHLDREKLWRTKRTATSTSWWIVKTTNWAPKSSRNSTLTWPLTSRKLIPFRMGLSDEHLAFRFKSRVKKRLANDQVEQKSSQCLIKTESHLNKSSRRSLLLTPIKQLFLSRQMWKASVQTSSRKVHSLPPPKIIYCSVKAINKRSSVGCPVKYNSPQTITPLRIL